MSGRTHDQAIYLRESRYDNPKELFKTLGALAIREKLLRPDFDICDFGCAAGELLHYLAQLEPRAHFRGFDIVPPFVEKARRNVPAAAFETGSVLDAALIPDASIDTAYLVGVLGIFDDFEAVLGNLIRWTRPGGHVVVVALFNQFPVDVWVKYRLAGTHDAAHREPGWNIFSRSSVEKYLDEVVKPKAYSFEPFEMPFDLPPNPDDVVRTWTVSVNGRPRLTNGLSMLTDLSILTITR